MSYDGRDIAMPVGIGTFVAWLVIAAVVLGMWGCPHYNVYCAQKQGEADLAHSISGKQVQVQDAIAKRESSTELANAEIERAKGVAAANKIIGDSLSNNESYLRYLWIHSLEVGKNEVIYVPTEANLPILEAGRYNNRIGANGERANAPPK